MFRRILNLKLLVNLTHKTNYSSASLHKPVLLDEIVFYLVKEPKKWNYKFYLDMTFGAGGHTTAILEANPDSVVYALDRDKVAIDLAHQLTVKYPGRLFPMHGKFSDIESLLNEHKCSLNSIDAALIDCGVSSMQFDNSIRGFSVSKDGPLDMRMTSDNDSITAADLVNKLDEKSLAKIIWKYGEEKLSKKIAHGIVYFRNAHGRIETTQQLVDVINSTVKQTLFDSLNRPTSTATKSFQALRIFVNNELNELYNGINLIHKYLKPQTGRLACISFHSLEDKIIKGIFNDIEINAQDDDEDEAQIKPNKLKKFKFKMNSQLTEASLKKTLRKNWTPLNKKVIVPTENEIEANPRSRSAKLRVACKN